MTFETARRARARFVRSELLSAAAALGPAALLPAPPSASASDASSPPSAGAAAAAAAAASRRACDAALAELLTLSVPHSALTASGAAAGATGASMDGSWTLVYAQRGTVVTRALAPPVSLNVPFSVPSPLVSDVIQTLTPVVPTAGGGGAMMMAADNEARISLGPLGTWRVRAIGTWAPQSGSASGGLEGAIADALVSFGELSIEPVAPPGAPAVLPALRLPLPAPLAARAARFRTLYLDKRVRVAEGAESGNRFVFERRKPGGGGGA
jgi:hypothetical protein